MKFFKGTKQVTDYQRFKTIFQKASNPREFKVPANTLMAQNLVLGKGEEEMQRGAHIHTNDLEKYPAFSKNVAEVCRFCVN